MKKDKEFWGLLASITIPIALQNLVSFMINMVDTVMLGALGEIPLSAASLANQPFFIFMIITFGIAGGGTVLSSQFWGKRDIESIKKVISIVVKVSILLSLVFSFLVLFFPSNIMKIYTSQQDVIFEGAKYLKIIGLGYIFFGATNSFLCSVRSVEIVKISVFVNILTLFTNMTLNWILIFGNLGFPALGIEGAAIATVISRVLEFVVVIVYILFIDKKLKMNMKDFFTFDKAIFKRLLRHSTPVVLNEVTWSIGVSCQSIILGHLGSEVVAAHSITNTVQQMATVIVFGIANAAAILVGKAIGQGDIQMAKNRSNRMFYISIFVGVISTATIISIRGLVVNFYNVSDSTKELAMQLMFVCAFIVFFISVSATFMIGVLRGAADTKFALAIETIALWGVSIPFALIATYLLKLPVTYIYGFMKTDEIIKSISCFVRTRGTKWIKDVTSSPDKLPKSIDNK